MCLKPQIAGRKHGCNSDSLPPGCLIPAAMDLAMVASAQWNSEFVTDFSAKRTTLCKPQMVSASQGCRGRKSSTAGEQQNRTCSLSRIRRGSGSASAPFSMPLGRAWRLCLGVRIRREQARLRELARAEPRRRSPPLGVRPPGTDHPNPEPAHIEPVYKGEDLPEPAHPPPVRNRCRQQRCLTAILALNIAHQIGGIVVNAVRLLTFAVSQSSPVEPLPSIALGAISSAFRFQKACRSWRRHLPVENKSENMTRWPTRIPDHAYSHQHDLQLENAPSF